MKFRKFCKSSWWFISSILLLIILPLIFWWMGQYYLSVTTVFISWLGSVLLIAVFFTIWHEVKNIYNKRVKK